MVKYSNYLEVIQEEFPLREGYEWGFKIEPNRHGLQLEKLTLSFEGVEFSQVNIINVDSISVWRLIAKHTTEFILISAYDRQDLLGSPHADPKPKLTSKKKWWTF